MAGTLMTGTLPVTVIGGYLGAGKTTLVNHVLRASNGLRLAVLVNDFGALPIDRDLIVAAEGDTIEISGGCVCCSYGSDLMDALIDLPRRRPGIDRVLLETSGVALPAMVASAVGLLPAYSVDGIVVLADAETVRGQAADVYIGDTIARQLAAADLVILNKCDLASDAARAETLRWLATQAPTARVVPAERGVVPAALLLGLTTAAPSAMLRTPGAIAADALYDSLALTVERAVDVEAVLQALVAAGSGVLRAKGFLREATGGLRSVNVVGRRYEVTEAPPHAPAGAFVAIGLRGQFDRAAVAHALGER